jgi:hypothetical protein
MFKEVNAFVTERQVANLKKNLRTCVLNIKIAILKNNFIKLFSSYNFAEIICLLPFYIT